MQAVTAKIGDEPRVEGQPPTTASRATGKLAAQRKTVTAEIAPDGVFVRARARVLRTDRVARTKEER